MLLTCPRCRTQFSAPDSAFAEGPRTVRCSLCKYTWRHPEGESRPGEKPVISMATSSFPPPSRPAQAAAEKDKQPFATNPVPASVAPGPAVAKPEPGTSSVRQGAPIPDFKIPQFQASESEATAQAIPADKIFTGGEQKAAMPNFPTASSATSGARSIPSMAEDQVAVSRLSGVQAPGTQASSLHGPKLPLEAQTENSPTIPPAMLSAATDAFPEADRSFFETNYAEEDAQSPVITMSEVRRQTQTTGRQESIPSPPLQKRSSYWLVLAACLLLFAALVLAVWFWFGAPQGRQTAAGQPINPVTTRALEFRLPSFGLGKSIDGLEFYDVVAAYQAENGMSRLIVEGEIRNTSAEAKALSPLRAVLFDDAGQPLADWTFDGGKPVLAVGETLRFHTLLNSPPTAAVNYEVAFTDPLVK